VGLKDDDKALFDYDKISAHHIVFDVIYKDTALVKKSKRKRSRCCKRPSHARLSRLRKL
jgi:shikimate 5-dehydrogenase